MLGDFNSVRKPDERRGISTNATSRREILEFNKFIDKTNFNDIPTVGRKYIWYRPNGTTKSRLNRILLTNEWLEHWPGSKQYILDRVISDHCALVLKRDQIDWGPKPFRTIDAWHNVTGFRKYVETKWDSYKDVFGYTNLQKQTIINKISELDKLDDESNLEDEMRLERRDLFFQLNLVNHREDAL